MSIVSPFVADIMLWLMYITVFVAVTVTLASVVKTLRMRTKDDETVNGVPQARIAWTTAGCIAVCLVATFLLGSSEPLTTNGHLFTSRFWLKTADMLINTSIILIIGCFTGVFVSRFRS